MDLQALRGFYWAGVHSSFSKAGNVLNVGQSAVSHQVKALEEELRVKLYEREGRGIRLTPAGRMLMAYVDIVLQTLDNIESHFAELAGSPEGTVTMAAYRGIMQYKLPQVVHSFKKKNPEIRLVIVNKPLDTEILDIVAAGDADFGITSSWNDFMDLAFYEVWSYDMFLCVPGNHRLAGRRRVSLKEIAREPLILYEPKNSIRSRIENILKENQLGCNVVIETSGATVIQEYVKIGQGVSLVSGLVTQATSDPALAYVPVTEHFGKLGYGVVLKKRKYLSLPVRKFLQELGLGDKLAAENWEI
ncbi:MAG: LysR family transcriptional regulator [Candidatus Zixiibacteriota bacterium]